MRIIAGVICDYAEVREGLLTIVSGGITRLWRPKVPAHMGIFLALQVELDPDERQLPHELQVLITDPSGAQAGKAKGGFQVGRDSSFEADECAVVNVPLDLRPVPVPAFGWYTLTTTIDGNTPAHTNRVLVARPPAKATGPGVMIAPHGEKRH